MKFKRILSGITASWLVLSCGFINLAVAGSNPVNTIISSENTISADTETTTQNQPLINSEVIKTVEESPSPTTNTDNNVISSGSSGDVNIINNSSVESGSTGDASIESTIITLDAKNSGMSIDSYTITLLPEGREDVVIDLGDSLKDSDVDNIPIILPLDTDKNTTNNSIYLTSSSGDLLADSNSKIGELNTGNSYANANVINILGSNVKAPEIFLGYITVRGNLTGDILLSDTLMDTLVPTNSVVIDQEQVEKREIQTRYELNNDVTTSSTSGEITASDNSSLGDMNTGSALNMLTAYDLLGLSIEGQSGLLVFVNVTGEWDGIIIGHDKGVTSALIGYSSDSIVEMIPHLVHNKYASLTNTINISSSSGDISALNNSKVGDIRTGNAVTIINIANIVGSRLNFTNSFGILFITILGDWFGSFGIDTPYGGQKVDYAPEDTLSREPDNTYSPPGATGYIFQPPANKTSYVFIENQETASETNPYVANYARDLENNNNPANETGMSYLTWIVPLIGGSIALGLLKANEKNN